MAAALVLASAEKADALGVPEERRVYLRGWGYAEDPAHVAGHPELWRSPAMAASAAAALAGAGIGVDDVAHLDLYSCFASSVCFALDALGIGPDDARAGAVTQTGGLPYHGGPGSNYMTHALAAMAETLRGDPGSYGVVSGVGMHMQKHAYGVWSTAPGPAAPAAPPPVAAADPVGIVASPEGDATVATYSVLHGRDGEPERALLVCDLPGGRALLRPARRRARRPAGGRGGGAGRAARDADAAGPAQPRPAGLSRDGRGRARRLPRRLGHGDAHPGGRGAPGARPGGPRDPAAGRRGTAAGGRTARRRGHRHPDRPPRARPEGMRRRGPAPARSPPQLGLPGAGAGRARDVVLRGCLRGVTRRIGQGDLAAALQHRAQDPGGRRRAPACADARPLALRDEPRAQLHRPRRRTDALEQAHGGGPGPATRRAAGRLSATRPPAVSPSSHRRPGRRATTCSTRWWAPGPPRRWVAGAHLALGGELDERGLRMEIIA